MYAVTYVAAIAVPARARVLRAAGLACGSAAFALAAWTIVTAALLLG